MRLPEPWLRGTRLELDPLRSQLLYSFQQAIEDIELFTANLSDDDVWKRPAGLPAVGFHIRHMAGSIDRLLTYCEGRVLSDHQFAALQSESQAGSRCHDLIRELRSVLDLAAQRVACIDPASYAETRSVGRQALPTTVGNLLVHIAEHTQRHVGQAITTAKLCNRSTSDLERA